MRHHFPSRELIREGHIGIPLAHRLPRGRLRTAYTATLRRLGFGILIGAKPSGELPPREWARRTLDWIDRYCLYRPYREIAHTFRRSRSRPARPSTADSGHAGRACVAC